MTRIVNIYDAKTNLSRLLADVANGEEILIAKAGEPIAKLSPLQPAGREIGFATGQIWIAEDFDATPEEIVEAFHQ
jgi:prevent-host-death family protein